MGAKRKLGGSNLVSLAHAYKEEEMGLNRREENRSEREEKREGLPG